MSSRFESAVLGSSLVCPNAVVWSEENLVAVACDNTVIILVNFEVSQMKVNCLISMIFAYASLALNYALYAFVVRQF